MLQLGLRAKVSGERGDQSLFGLFRAEAGRFAKCFWCDCDPKLSAAVIKRHLTSQGSDIMHAAAGRQPSKGLVESHWKTMVHMSRAYLTEK